MKPITPIGITRYLFFNIDLGFGQYGTIAQKITKNQYKQLTQICLKSNIFCFYYLQSF